MGKLVDQGDSQGPLSPLVPKPGTALGVLEVVTIGFVDDDVIQLVRVRGKSTPNVRMLTDVFVVYRKGCMLWFLLLAFDFMAPKTNSNLEEGLMQSSCTSSSAPGQSATPEDSKTL